VYFKLRTAPLKAIFFKQLLGRPLLQVGDVLIGLLELPAWTGKALVALIAVGMPDFLEPVRTLQCLLHEANK